MLRFATFSTTALALSMTGALGAPAVGLVGDRTLVLFDTETLEVSGSAEVEGVDRLLGIDLRPADGTLVGVTTDFVVLEITPETGEAREMSRMDTALPAGDMPVIVDFNPMADKLRFMTGTTNHRVDVDSGAVTVDGNLAFEGNDMHVGEDPAIVAAAYINSHGKPDGTAMYDIDRTIGALIQQTSPNDGTLAAVGKLGLEMPAENYAFDIETSAQMENTGWLVNGATLYTVDLETGTAMEAGTIEGIEGEFRDITVLHEM
jgi:hypothetical protein